MIFFFLVSSFFVLFWVFFAFSNLYWLCDFSLMVEWGGMSKWT